MGFFISAVVLIKIPLTIGHTMPLRQHTFFYLAGKLGLCVVFAALISPVMAQNNNAADAEIVVTATRQPLSILAVPAALDVVNAEKLRTTLPAVDISEFLSRVPGLNIQNRQNYAQDTQISTRGFGARATFGIRGIKLFVDDIPVTIPDGQAQGALIPLDAMTRLEVLRGPWAVGYGNAAGGVIAASTSSTINQTTTNIVARSLRGADGLSVDSMVAIMPPITGWFDAVGRVGGLFSHQQFATDGFRDHSKTIRDHSYLRVDSSLTPTATLMLTANIIDQPESQDPLGITRQQLDQNPRQAGTNAELFNSRKSIQHRQFGGVFADNLADMSAKIIVYGGSRSITQYLTTPVTAQAAVTSAGGVIVLDRDFSGVGLRLAQQRSPINWSVGVDVDRAVDARRGYENFVRDGSQLRLGVIGNKRRDETNIQQGVDIYGQLSAPISGSWRAHVGARQSQLKFLVRDHFVRPGNGDDSGNAKFAAFSPAVGVVRTLDGDNTRASIYLNLGRGFETPTASEMAYRQDQASGLNLDLIPSRNYQFEMGHRHQVANFSSSVTAFLIQSRNEIVQSSVSAGRSNFQNAARTSRYGVETSISWRPSAAWETTFAWTSMRASVVTGYVAGAGAGVRDVAAGSLLPAAPRQNLFAELAWRRNLPGWSAVLALQARSRMAVDDINSAFAAGYTTLAASINFRHTLMVGTQPFELDTFVRIDNVFDHAYVGSVITNEANQRYYEPSPGRRGLLGLNVRWRF